MNTTRTQWKNVRAAINRHLKDSGRVIDIVNGTNFTSANKMLCAKLKNNLKTGVSRPTQHYPVIDAEELTKIHEYLKKRWPCHIKVENLVSVCDTLCHTWPWIPQTVENVFGSDLDRCYRVWIHNVYHTKHYRKITRGAQMKLVAKAVINVCMLMGQKCAL